MASSEQLTFDNMPIEDDKHAGQILALSLSQPFANLVAKGIKTIETRAWATRHRGDLLICAAKSGTGEPKGVALCLVCVEFVEPMTEEHVEAACVDVYQNAKAWHLSNVRLLSDQFPLRGMPGLFYVDMSDEIKGLVA